MSAPRQPLYGGLARAAAAREARLLRHRWQAGQVVVGIVRNLREQPGNIERRRPLILVGPVAHDPGVWRVAGLTTQAATRGDGTDRLPVVDWAAIPLEGPAWYWSPRLAYVPSEDLLHPIGWVTPGEVDAIDAMTRITADERAALARAATRHRAGRAEP